MTEISIGLRNDTTIDIDLHSDEDEQGGEWNYNNVTLEEAEFIREELTLAIERGRARQAKMMAKATPVLNVEDS